MQATQLLTSAFVPHMHMPLHTKSLFEQKSFFVYERHQSAEFNFLNDYSKINIFENSSKSTEFSEEQQICCPVPRKAVQTYMHKREAKKNLNVQVLGKFYNLKQRNNATFNNMDQLETDLSENFNKLLSAYDRIENLKKIKKQSRLPRSR